jgi:fucose permease
LSGLLTQKFGARLPVVAGAMLAAFGWVIAMGLPTSLTGVIALLCVISFGTTILNAAIPNVIVGAVSDERTSEAVGTMSVLRGLANAIGVQFIAVLMASSTVTAPEGGAAFPSAAGYRLAMGWIAVLTFAGAAIALLLRVRQHGAMETATT